MKSQRARSGLAVSILGLALVLIGGIVLINMLAGPSSPSTPASDAPKDDRGRTIISLAYSPEKAQLFTRLVTEFNKQSKEYSVQATSLEMDAMLPQALEGRFAAISPDSAVWLGSLDQEWLAKAPNRANLVGSLDRFALSPVVVAMWEGEARKMGHPGKAIGWADIAQRATAEPTFRWSHPSTTTAAGLLTTTAEFYAAKAKTGRLSKEDIADAGARDFVRRVESTVQQYGAETEDQVLQRLLDQRQRTLDAFVGQEALVVRFNRQTRGEKLVAVYPREGTLWMDHPLVLLEGPWLKPEHRRGFQQLSTFLRSAPMQRVVLQEGYRPADLSISLDDPESQIKAANGVDPAQPQTMLQIPSFAVVEEIRDLWALLKRPANIYLVADVSGSMSGEKIERAQEALLSFIDQVKGDADRLALASFSTSVQELVPLGPIAQNRERLRNAVRGLRASGNTALYDATLFGAERLHNLRQSDRINVVLVMSDGIENVSRRVRSGPDPRPLITALEEQSRRSGISVLVFTVAYGSDADLNALRLISESTRGAAYEGKPETIRQLYKLLSAFF